MSDLNIPVIDNISKVPENKRLFMDPAKCTACRSCELMCSFHHSGVFSTKDSSIIIKRNDNEGIFGYYFLSTCDLCSDLEIPMCVEACYAHALCLK
jgi:Fe-S-cluster-containing hydrogenase component 2